MGKDAAPERAEQQEDLLLSVEGEERAGPSTVTPRPRSLSSSLLSVRPGSVGGLLLIAAFVSAAALLCSRAVLGSPSQTGEVDRLAVDLGAASGCCSWNHLDCGHGGKFCQTGPAQCSKCNGQWGNFQDVCVLGHPPAMPLVDIWPFHAKQPLKIKVLSYNLEWWATGGGQAGQVIKDSSKTLDYDFMGFQECNDPWHVLWLAGLQKEYKAIHVNRGPAVDICMTWRKSNWTLVSQGVQQVAWDKKYGGRYTMWGRFEHTQTKEIVFFMNHHGPLPLNSGGTGGGAATAASLLSTIRQWAKPGDAIVLVGDFNADGGSLTVRQLECKLSHVAFGEKYNGVDNVFANVPFSRVDDGHGKSLVGGNSDHDALMVVIDLAPGADKKEERKKGEKEERKKDDEEERKNDEEEERKKDGKVLTRFRKLEKVMPASGNETISHS